MSGTLLLARIGYAQAWTLDQRDPTYHKVYLGYLIFYPLTLVLCLPLAHLGALWWISSRKRTA